MGPSRRTISRRQACKALTRVMRAKKGRACSLTRQANAGRNGAFQARAAGHVARQSPGLCAMTSSPSARAVICQPVRSNSAQPCAVLQNGHQAHIAVVCVEIRTDGPRQAVHCFDGPRSGRY
jgi:hypothetical protein